jgi:hypothetical protein
VCVKRVNKKTVKRVTVEGSQDWQGLQGIFLLRNTIILTQEHNILLLRNTIILTQEHNILAATLTQEHNIRGKAPVSG